MFKSTYGYLKDIKRAGERRLVFKVTDFENDMDVFQIGSESSPDECTYGEVYCLRIGQNYIPFGIYSRSVESHTDIIDFNESKYFKRRTKYNIPIVTLEISNFGEDLIPLSEKVSRGRLEYQNVWDNESHHGYLFKTEAEKEVAFSYLQRALPILFL